MAEQSIIPFHTEGVKVNPLAGALLADSGPMTEGSHTFAYMMGCTVSARVAFEWRDSIGTLKHSQPIFLPISQMFMHTHPPAVSLVCAEGDTLQIVVGGAAIIGAVQATLSIA
jgi:hypothetical protein